MANLPYADMIDLLRRRGVGMDAQDPKTVQQPTIVPPQRVNPVLPEMSPTPTGEDQLPPAAPIQTSGPVQTQARALGQVGTPPPVPKFQPLTFSKSGAPSINPDAQGNPVEIEQLYQRALDRQKTPKWKDVASGIIQGAAAMGGNQPQYPVDISGKDVRMRESMGRLQRELGVQKEQAQIEAEKSVPYYRQAMLNQGQQRIGQGDQRIAQGNDRIAQQKLSTNKRTLASIYNGLPEFRNDDPKNSSTIMAMDQLGLPHPDKVRGSLRQLIEGTDADGNATFSVLDKSTGVATEVTGDNLPTKTEGQLNRESGERRSANQVAAQDRRTMAENSRYYAGLGQKEANELRDRHDKISKVAGEYASYRQLASDPSTPKANRAGLQAAADGRRRQLENSGLYDFDSNGNATPKSIPPPTTQTAPGSSKPGKIQPGEDPQIRDYANKHFNGSYQKALEYARKTGYNK